MFIFQVEEETTLHLTSSKSDNSIFEHITSTSITVTSASSSSCTPSVATDRISTAMTSAAAIGRSKEYLLVDQVRIFLQNIGGFPLCDGRAQKTTPSFLFKLKIKYGEVFRLYVLVRFWVLGSPSGMGLPLGFMHVNCLYILWIDI